MGPFNMGPFNMGPFNMGPFNIGAFFCGAFIHYPHILRGFVLVLLQTISVFSLKWIFPCSDSRFIIAYDILQYLKERYWLIFTSTPCLVCQTARKPKLRKTDQILGDLFQSDIPSDFDWPSRRYEAESSKNWAVSEIRCNFRSRIHINLILIFLSENLVE